MLHAAGGILAARRHDDDRRLQQLVADALLAGTGGAMRLRRPDSPLDYAVHVLPLAEHDRLATPDGPAVAIFIADPARFVGAPAERLVALWGLTRQEAALALHLAEGLELRSCATRLAITESTARVHLTAIFRKTATRRQAELIRLLLTTVLVIDAP